MMSDISANPKPSREQRRPEAPEGALDHAAFEVLFRSCAGDVHGYLLSLLGDRAAAQDVTALAFERLWRSRSRLDRGRGTPRAWLFAIARNAALDELRRRRHESLPLPADGPADAGAGDALEDVERRAAVRDALGTLPLRERELVLLKFHGQLSNGELARALGISESNAGTRLHRALSHLRQNCAQQTIERDVA
jgi:RNA polymerase sigma-70 factor, ECF subfamily